MKTNTQTTAKADSGIMSIVLVAFVGLAILFGAGFANSGTIHDSAHDTRHITGFACH
ncbi:MAG: CbtB-domain containing protein [Rhodobacteraceae bacterium]|nr:CbtB-domain containing protein [Paracoccaceae bacterium]